MRTDKNYYLIMLKYPEDDDDGTCFSLQTRFDSFEDAVKYALLINSNYLKELDLRVGWCVRYYSKVVVGEWSSKIVAEDTDLADLRIFEEIKEGGESNQ